jgi:hypothetical protein
MDFDHASPREIRGTPDNQLSDTIVEDILNHISDPVYDVLYIPNHKTKHIYRFFCPDFATISKDPNYIRSCIFQARFEARRPDSNDKFKGPQPFQLTLVPRYPDN